MTRNPPGRPQLELAAAHLNASVGALVTAQDIADALSRGSFKAIGSAPAAALASTMFVELEPRLIAMCASEAGATLGHAQRLYSEYLAEARIRVPAWELAMEHLG